MAPTTVRQVFHCSYTRWTNPNGAFVLHLTNIMLFIHQHMDQPGLCGSRNWLPFQSTMDVQNHSDFGLRFRKGGSGGTAAQVMNEEGCGIFPYIEPHVIHWPINGSGPCHTGEAWSNWTANISGCATWSEVNQSVMDCIANPATHNTSATSGPLPILCNEIESSALYGPSRERWFYRPENVPWNQGAMLYPALNTHSSGSSKPCCTAQAKSKVFMPVQPKETTLSQESTSTRRRVRSPVPAELQARALQHKATACMGRPWRSCCPQRPRLSRLFD